MRVSTTCSSGRNVKSFVYKPTTKIAVPKLLACQLVTTVVQLRCCWVCSPACLVLTDPLGCAASRQGWPGPGEQGEQLGAVPSSASHSLLVLVLPLLPAPAPHPFCRDRDAHKGGAGVDVLGLLPLALERICELELETGPLSCFR